MNSALDFVSRGRRAWAELRHPEQHEPPQEYNGYNGPQQPQEPDQAALPRPSIAPPVAPIDPTEALTNFRLLVGIYQDKSFAAPRGWVQNRRPQVSLLSRPAPNIGIYSSVCEAEIKAKRNFKFFSRLINSCLGLQIVVAAALTALGAADGSRSAVTVFGAINTVIAGIMTYLKGSGMPNRIKYFQHEWAKVREYIEQRERDFTLNVPGLDVHDEIEKIRRMYEVVKADIERNTPDRFVSVSQLTGAQAMRDPPPPLARPQASFSTDNSPGRHWLNEKETEANTAINKAHSAGQGMFGKFGHLKDVLEDKVKEIGQMEKDVESHGRHMADEKKHGLVEQFTSTFKDVAHLGKEIENNAKAEAAAVGESVTRRQHDVQESLARGQHGIEENIARGQHGIEERERDVEEGLARRQHDIEEGIAGRQHDIESGLGQSSEAVRTALQRQRDALNTAMGQQHEEGVPPKPTQ